MDKITIGSFIAEKRRQRKMTQEQLGELLGVSSKSISRWENGNTMPDILMISDIANILDVQVSELLNGCIMSEEEKNILIKALVKDTEIESRNKKTKFKIRASLIIGILLLIIAIINIKFDILEHLFCELASRIFNITFCVLGFSLGIMAIHYNEKHH